MADDSMEEIASQAARALASGQSARALAIADQMAALEPENPFARIIRAHALLLMGSFNEAYRESQIAALLEPDNDDAQMVLALSAWRVRRLDIAEQAFEQALELSNRNPEFRAQYAWFLATERAPRLGARAAEQVLEKSPRSSVAWAALGMAQLRLHQTQQAEETLRRAFEIDPECPEAQSAMIRILKRRGDVQKADNLREALRGLPKSRLAFVHEIAGTDEAVEKEEVAEPPVVDLVRVPKWPAWIRPAGASLLIVGLFLMMLPRHPVMALASFLLASALAYATRRHWMTSDDR